MDDPHLDAWVRTLFARLSWRNEQRCLRAHWRLLYLRIARRLVAIGTRKTNKRATASLRDHAYALVVLDVGELCYLVCIALGVVWLCSAVVCRVPQRRR